MKFSGNILIPNVMKKKNYQLHFLNTCINDILSINKDYFHSYVDFIHPSELEDKDTTDSSNSAAYLGDLLSLDAGRLTAQLYEMTKLTNCNQSHKSYTTNRMISILPLSTSHIHVHIHVTKSHYHLHMAHISLKGFDIQGLALNTISF
jgi:hypothetical protein